MKKAKKLNFSIKVEDRLNKYLGSKGESNFKDCFQQSTTTTTATTKTWQHGIGTKQTMAKSICP
jgi:hypothetical protein